MNQRGGGEPTADPGTLDELIASMESGSRPAGRRLVSLVLEYGRRSDASRGGEATGPDRRAAIIDRVARSAADGSPYALETLIDLVAAADLAGPALSRVLPAGVQPDDVTQEILVALTSSIHRFRGESRFTTWFYTLARNVAVSHLRRHHRPVAPLEQAGHGAEPGRRRLSSVVSERTMVQAAIDTLPPKFQDVVRLRDLDGLSYAEIAARTGLEPTTVRSRLARGRAMLSNRLA